MERYEDMICSNQCTTQCSYLEKSVRMTGGYCIHYRRKPAESGYNFRYDSYMLTAEEIEKIEKEGEE